MSSRPSRGAARLAAILDALPDALVLVNANGTVVNANTIALEAFETPGTALVGRGLLDLLPEFDSRLIPGSMRRPDTTDERGRTKPTRMIARRTDGSEFPVEVTSANLESGQQAYDNYGPTPDELLMLVVRDLSGTVDTEAELARSQRQTEMILRAAAEGVVGTDTEGRVVLVNPAAAQILGYRASDLGGKDLHELILHSRADGEAFPFEESPLADTLRSGRKHRVRGQVLWSKSGDKVPVDLTTSPVRDGDQLVGAVMTFTDRRPYDTLVEEKEAAATRHAEELEQLVEEHTAELAKLRERHTAELTELTEGHEEELAAGEERYASLGEREKDRYEALAARHEQLLAVLGHSLRGPLDQLRGELAKLAADDAGQLWPEANQVLHHLAAGYSRITTLVDNVLGYQRLDAGIETIFRTNVMLDAVVAAGIEGAVDLIGPGRVQFAVHAPPIEAEVDPQRLARALAHLVADVAGVDATGNAPVSAGGYMDNTVVVAAAQRGEVVRIEVRGPYAGGDPVHEPIVRGIVRAHGGVLQTHEVPGMSGSAYVLEVPIGGGAGAVPPGTGVAVGAEIALAEQAPQQSGGRRRARRASTDAFLESEESGETGPQAVEAAGATAPTGRRRRRAAEDQAVGEPAVPGQEQPGDGTEDTSGGTGRRRGRPSSVEETGDAQAEGTPAGVSEGAVVMAGEHGSGTAAVGSGLGGTVPPQGVPVPVPSGRRARRDGEQNALPAAPVATAPDSGPDDDGTVDEAGRPTGRRRRALAAAAERASAQETGARAVFALPPAEADRSPEYVRAEAQAQAAQVQAAEAQAAQVQAARAQVAQAAQDQVQAQVALAQQPDGRHDAMRHDPDDDHTPPQPHPVSAPTGRRRARQVAEPAPEAAPGAPAQAVPAQGLPGQPVPALGQTVPAQGLPAQGVPVPATAGRPVPPGLPAVAAQPGSAPAAAMPAPAPVAQPWPDANNTTGAGAQPALPAAAPAPLPPERPAARVAQPLPAEATPASAPADPNSTQGRAISVRTLGQGVPFARQVAAAQPGGGVQAPTPPHGTNSGGRRRKLGTPPEPAAERPETAARALPQAGPRRPGTTEGAGRSYAIGAPDENAAEGPEPLDGPGGAVEVADQPQPRPVDDELPPEPLDNPRRLLVWPAPDAGTQQALTDRGYRPVIVNSREEVDAQIAAFPAALFVDPLTGPITRTALQSLRQAAVAAEVPVLVTAGLGQATREAAYGADPAVLLKALAPRDSEQHPPRVLLIEEHAEIALALTATLERRGMQVARASTDEDAVTLAAQMRPNLVVMDLMQVRRRRAGIVDWLRANGQLNRTPLVVYTAAVDASELPRLAAGESVLFLAERSTSDEVQDRIVDLLARIGTN
ncbi:hybrid sensor histidine kinase/response regulator [Streptomyces sp. NBC_00151]|uniref:hybrid sensor histidine kinase/response regulator n=1 Tax=Streptomyces sp. NBC_00151 TaxID=2975669 RepID=UPI002DDAF108|nr:PAS domain-containing protein [Streptomyces sp. NBC_00151]WRZ40834.1 PAS domain-containing protein [Streptomyces sp. NBC_00151]